MATRASRSDKFWKFWPRSKAVCPQGRQPPSKGRSESGWRRGSSSTRPTTTTRGASVAIGSSEAPWHA
eukprot:15697269-Heterocapsa_arctica.AAC.1